MTQVGNLDYVILCSFVCAGFTISPAGPEIWVVFILINTFVVVFGTGSFIFLLPLTVILCFSGLVVNTFQIQKRLWQEDMAIKEREETP
ncbi:MAG: hypothetical protein KKF30_16345 [Proteobacteria bacterium]|nr:hypothetical protein [Pseudomonadota bacterium]MBU4472004.1 hypothetical protein [Pseudomonadota bacterium]MCG2752996.1 hypothetical protein [Desulfobacteraceae bacterium]